MSDDISFPGCFACGYYNPRRQSCGLIPEHRDILCPFGEACPAAPDGAVPDKGGDSDGL